MRDRIVRPRHGGLRLVGPDGDPGPEWPDGFPEYTDEEVAHLERVLANTLADPNPGYATWDEAKADVQAELELKRHRGLRLTGPDGDRRLPRPKIQLRPEVKDELERAALAFLQSLPPGGSWDPWEEIKAEILARSK